MSYYPLRMLRYGRRGFPTLLNAPASTYAAEAHNVSRYKFRRELLSYYAEKDDAPFISGHYPFNHALYDNPKNDWNFVTLLRDPIKRWYSEYLWNRYKDHHYERTDMSAEAYMESPAGMMNARSYVNYFSRWIEPYKPPSEMERKDALETLSKMTVVGCLEHMDRFREDMRYVFGRKPVLFNRNVSPAPTEEKKLPDENSDVHKRLLELTEVDREIYETAKRMIGL